MVTRVVTRVVTRLVTCWRLRPKPQPERRAGEREWWLERSWAWLCRDFSNLANRQDWTNWRPPSAKSWEPEAVKRLMELRGWASDLTAHEDHGTWWRVQPSGYDNNLGHPHTSHLTPLLAALSFYLSPDSRHGINNPAINLTGFLGISSAILALRLRII